MNRDPDADVPSSPPYFWWLLANLLALCFAVLSWVFCLEIFGNPDVPANYKVLEKLGRVPQLKDFRQAMLPEGSLHGPRDLYRKFFDVTDDQFAQLNRQFLRNHLGNYGDAVAVTFIEGDYQIQEVRTCGADDYLVDGVVVRARALVRPDDFSPPVLYPVVIEYLFPTLSAEAAAAFEVGQTLSVRKVPHAAVVLHAGKHLEGDEQVVRLTVIPLVYGDCRLGTAGNFALEVPAKVRPDGQFPCFGENASVPPLR